MTLAFMPPRPTGVELRAQRSMAAAVHDLDARRARSRQLALGASELGECRRRAVYRILRKRPTNRSTGLQAALGTMIHKGVLAALKRQYGGLVEVKLGGELIRGSCDWLDELVVEDLKTVGYFGYESITSGGAPKLRHRFQGTTYAWLLRTGQIKDKRLDGPVDVQAVRIRYLSRDSGADTPFEDEYDPQLAAEALAWLGECYRLAEEVPLEDVPRDGYGPKVDSRCDFCPFLTACWGEQEETDGTTTSAQARVLTHTDADREAAVADYVEWRDAEKEAKQKKEFARERLRGSAGTFAGYTLAWQGGNSNWTVDKDAALDRLVEIGEVIPTKLTTSAVSIRIRKAKEE